MRSTEAPQEELTAEWWQWRSGLVNSAAAEVSAYQAGDAWGRSDTGGVMPGRGNFGRFLKSPRFCWTFGLDVV